jgi:hypothetical protein
MTGFAALTVASPHTHQREFYSGRISRESHDASAAF